MIPKTPIPRSLIMVHEDRFIPLIQRFQTEGTLHPTLLVSGIEGVGKKEMIAALVRRVFCDQPGTGLNTCEKCKSCIRSSQNQWLDLHWFDPDSDEDDGKLGTHKIDAFRELKEKMGIGPSDEPFRVVVIANADRMTPQAANSILKTLEEPPPRWLFILTAADSSRLLPTILSRCVEIKLRPLEPNQILSILQEMQGLELQSNRARFAARIAEGSLNRARLFLDEEPWKIRDQILGLLSNPAAEWMKLVETLSGSQKNLLIGMDLMETIIIDLLKSSIDSNHVWMHEDQKDFLTQWMESKKMTPQKLVRILSEISNKRRFATLTLNSKLLAQETLIPLLETLVS